MDQGLRMDTLDRRRRTQCLCVGYREEFADCKNEQGTEPLAAADDRIVAASRG